MNNAEVQHIFSPAKVTELVDAAIAGWIEKNPQASEEEILKKRADIATNITQSRIKDKFLNSKANRQARRAHVAEKVAQHGLEFTTGSRTIMIEDPLELPEEAHRKSPFLSGLIEDLFDLVPLKKPYEQTVTYCFKHEAIGYGLIGVKVAMAFQNPDDEPDSLVAREYALARFVNGKVYQVVLPAGDVTKVGGIHAALRQALGETGVCDDYFEKFVQL